MRPRPALAAAIAAVLALWWQPAAAEPVSAHYISAELISEHETIRPGTPFTLGVLLRPDEGWHVYWRNPGHTGLPTRVQWKLPAGFGEGPLQWPHPQRFGQVPLVTYGYEGDTLLLADITPPSDLRAGETVDLAAKVSWLVCKADACVPGKAEVSLRIGVEEAVPQPDSRWSELFASARRRIPARLPQWNTRVEAAGDGVTMSLQAPADQQPSVKTIEVFPIDNDLVDPDTEPRITRTAGGFTVEMARADNDKPVPATFAAVLVASEGWDLEGRVHAIEVSAPVHFAPGSAAHEQARAAAAGEPAAGAGQDSAATASGAAGTTATETRATAEPGASGRPTSGVGSPASVPSPAQGGAADVTLLVALSFALLGGVILNLMPCVFPVLSLKVLGFVHVAHHESARVRRHGLAFAGGVLVSFWILAALLLVLRAGGSGLGWGFQLQQPLFVAALALLLLAMSLNLLGVFEFGASVTGAAGRFDSHSGYHGSFLSGVLATVLATPCSAPFMGAALGYALVQPPLASLLVFTALGSGMAAPYVLLSFAPSLLRVLPRPGPWMETLRQVMAFPLLATLIWLVWVFGRQVGVDAVPQLLAAMLLMSIGLWLAGRSTPRRDGSGRWAARLTTTALLAGGLAVAVAAAERPPAPECAPASSGEDIAWIPYDAGRLTELREQGRPVFLDFTAAWCLSCKVNETLALGTEAVRRKMRELNVVAMRGDWTSGDPAITAVLESFGRDAVPLYVVYPRGHDGAAVVLPAILSQQIVIDALERAAG